MDLMLLDFKNLIRKLRITLRKETKEIKEVGGKSLLVSKTISNREHTRENVSLLT